MSLRSERLKKLEAEFTDLQQWLRLGLVPKKDIQKHKEEIAAIESKIFEERERLQFLKESEDGEEFVAPKRQSGRGNYAAEQATMTEMNIDGTEEGGYDSDTETGTETEENTTSPKTEKTKAEDESEAADEESEKEDEDTDPFSDRNRWRRGWDRQVVLDPDADEW